MGQNIQKILHTSILQNSNYGAQKKELGSPSSPRVVSAELQQPGGKKHPHNPA